MEKITIIIGLCNNLIEFDWTRHNIAKNFLLSTDLIFENQKSFLICKEEDIFKNKIYWIIPKTYMNLSGNIFKDNFLKNIYQKYTDIKTIIIHDDLSVNFGKFKIRNQVDRGPRGHNGNRSIINAMSFLQGENYNQPIYFSLGIDRSTKYEVDKWVLMKFSEEEKNYLIKNVFGKAYQELLIFLSNTSK